MKSEAAQAADKVTPPLLFMCRIPPVSGEKYHVVGEVSESDPDSEPKRAFWTNASVKALMQQTPRPEYASLCGKVRGDWRSIETSIHPYMVRCGDWQCATTRKIRRAPCAGATHGTGRSTLTPALPRERRWAMAELPTLLCDRVDLIEGVVKGELVKI